ncbi:MAG TPA: hypothetical protein VJI13_00660 [Candidatus Norongarragalinales archaeon]|nr:hypothetical protein [Candidatus Norongarragalinales archaeon]
MGVYSANRQAVGRLHESVRLALTAKGKASAVLDSLKAEQVTRTGNHVTAYAGHIFDILPKLEGEERITFMDGLADISRKGREHVLVAAARMFVENARTASDTEREHAAAAMHHYGDLLLAAGQLTNALKGYIASLNLHEDPARRQAIRERFENIGEYGHAGIIARTQGSDKPIAGILHGFILGRPKGSAEKKALRRRPVDPQHRS